MKTFGIIVGEDADLPEKLISKNGIITFPFVVDWDEFSAGKKFYKLMRSAKEGGPKTSQPSSAVFKKLFEQNLKKFDELFVITVSSKFSGTYNAAVTARKTFVSNLQKRIHIIDSETSSGAEGLLVLQILKDKDLQDIKKLIPKIKLLGVFDDVKWLVAGGRISTLKGIVVKNMIKGGLRPVLTIRDGEIVVKKIQAKGKDRVQALFAVFCDEADLKKTCSVVITHADCAADAKKLASKLEKFSKSVKIEYIHEISPVIGSHLGPDTLLLSWL